MGIFNPSGSVKRHNMWAIGETRNAMNQSLSDLAPYAGQGGAAWGRLGDFYGLNGQGAADEAMAGYRASPGYNFQLAEGTRAIENSAAARGGLNSGATLKALTSYGQNLADSDFQQYLAGLGGLGTVGYNAANAGNAVRQGATGQIAQSIMGIGNAKASESSGYLGALGSIGGAALSAFGGPAMGGISKGLGALFNTGSTNSQLW